MERLEMEGWRQLEFASFDHYAEERLGLCGRAVQQRASLERQLDQLPSLRHAAGGSGEPGNLVSPCAAHRLRGVHFGHVRVRRTAPDGLTWEHGVRPGMAPVPVVAPASPKACG